MLTGDKQAIEDDLKLARRVVSRLDAMLMAPAEKSVVELAGVVERMLLRELERAQSAQ